MRVFPSRAILLMLLVGRRHLPDDLLLDGLRHAWGRFNLCPHCRDLCAPSLVSGGGVEKRSFSGARTSTAFDGAVLPCAFELSQIWAIRPPQTNRDVCRLRTPIASVCWLRLPLTSMPDHALRHPVRAAPAPAPAASFVHTRPPVYSHLPRIEPLASDRASSRDL